MPGAEVNAPPLIEYSPPVMEIGAFPVMPEMTMSLEATPVDRAVPD
jgi:hypothetical protein